MVHTGQPSGCGEEEEEEEKEEEEETCQVISSVLTFLVVVSMSGWRCRTTPVAVLIHGVHETCSMVLLEADHTPWHVCQQLELSCAL